MKLWQKNFSVNKKVEQFTIGNDGELDPLLAKYDIIASKAHAEMLCSISLLTTAELESVIKGFREIELLVESGRFVIEDGVEDIHSQIELLLTRFAGEAGKKIHTARSRNDQVLTAIKLFLKDELSEIEGTTNQLIHLFYELSKKYKAIALPGYTHFQVAMPSTFGLWFGAYAESLEEDLGVLRMAYAVCDKNPLGSAAGYGSNFPVDKQLTSRLMGFTGTIENPVYAQMTRGKTEKQAAWAIAGIAASLGKFAYDVCLYMCGNFNFISFPDELTTGSSIMPHKKNPDVFELVRARCNLLQGVPNQLTLLCSNLPHGYHRDMQLTKQVLFPALKDIKECLEMTSLMIRQVRVNEKILDDPKYRYLFSVDQVNELVMQGIPFREAYKLIGEKIQRESE